MTRMRTGQTELQRAIIVDQYNICRCPEWATNGCGSFRNQLRESDACLTVDSVDLPEGTDVGSGAEVEAQVIVPHCLHDLLERGRERDVARWRGRGLTLADLSIVNSRPE